jgi:alternate F1F0 ATPase F1 subunit gamma
MKASPHAGKPADESSLVNVPRLVTAYYAETPDPSAPEERVAFGTSGHRGSSFTRTFNERHILAITQAICLYRQQRQIDGPLFLGMDTHALSVPALTTALEVLAANEVEVMLAQGDEYTPTPAVSHAILTYNRKRTTGLADGIVITPSHNPPHDGGFKYNPPNGGPAESGVTTWIETKANEFLQSDLAGVTRAPFEKALHAATTHRHDYLDAYIADLANVLDMDAIRAANIHMGVDPLGGAGVHYWSRIADRYKLNLTVVSEAVDPTFRFMTVDWDGQIRMFGSDQGLVGQFNDIVADDAVKALGVMPGRTLIWAVGERVHARLADAGLEPTRVFEVPSSVAAIAPLVGEILVEAEARYDRIEVTELHLFYNRSKAGAAFVPVRERLLPLDDEWYQTRAAVPWPTKMLPEVIGAGTTTLRALVREYLFVSLFRASAESLASENASRLAAMARAEKNIGESLESLQGAFHRVRQSGIDEELFDVVSGSEALSKTSRHEGAS